MFFGVFLFLLTLIAPVGLEAANQSLQVQKLMTLPADELLEQGSRFADKEDVEHAVMCYTIIVNRYDDSMKAADKMRNYTVEAIAGMVGYRSRNSFTAAFKRITGLYPSEYIRIARERL